MTTSVLNNGQEQVLNKVQEAVAVLYEEMENDKLMNKNFHGYQKGFLDALKEVSGYIDHLFVSKEKKIEVEDLDEESSEVNVNFENKEMDNDSLSEAFDYMFENMRNIEKTLQHKYGKKNGTNLIASFIDAVKTHNDIKNNQ